MEFRPINYRSSPSDRPNYEETRQFQNEKVSWSDKALPFIHLAYEALLYVPLSFFSYQTAYFLFLAVNFGFLAWAYSLMKPHLLNLGEIWTPIYQIYKKPESL